MFDAQEIVRAFAFALLKAGKSIAARIAMMAITTSNSIKVKPAGERRSPIDLEEFEGSSFISLTCGAGTVRLCNFHAPESSDPDRRRARAVDKVAVLACELTGRRICSACLPRP